MSEVAEETKKGISTGRESSSEVAGYRSIFKATSIFGGVQVFNIIISLVRGKILAVLIGTAGMGLNGLLMSSLTLLKKVSGMGLDVSAVRDISSAHSSEDEKSIRVIYTIFRRWIWISAFIGVFLTIALAPLLSKIAFADKSYTISFILLSITFVFNALTGGIYTLLRGLRKIKTLANANIAGATAGLIIAIPIFYFWGIKGVVPAIIASSAITYIVSIYYKKKIAVKPFKLSLKETLQGGRKMVILGLTLTFTGLLSAGVKFFINAYISKTGSLNDLGIYNAGHSIMAGYVGMVFTAMATDYYPRLSGVINHDEKWKRVVNQQAETILLILGPIISFILLSAPVLIKILLSKEFLASTGFIIWACLAVMLRGITYVSGFIFIAKGDNKIFLVTEVAAQIWFLILNIILFNMMGTTGLGIAMAAGYFLSTLLMVYVLKRYYNFVLSGAVFKLITVFMIITASTITVIHMFDYPRAYYFAGLMFIISLIISISGLNKRMNLVEVIRSIIKKKNE